MDNNNDRNVYFGNKDTVDCTKVLMDKVETWRQGIFQSRILDQIQRSNSFYQGSFENDSYSGDNKISFAGDQGELLNMPVNHYRNIAKHILNMTTANRPAIKTRAVNTDYKSVTQTVLADGLIDYYMREQGLEDVLKKATEYSIVLGEGWVKIDWDANAGEEYELDDESGQAVRTGDLVYRALTPLDVIRDVYKTDEIHNWLITKTFKNKFDLAAKFPDFKDKIIKLSTSSEENLYRFGTIKTEESDEIPVYEFYHAKTDAVPQGRYILFLNADIAPIDLPLPYPEIPLYLITDSFRIGTSFGYTEMFSLLSLQEAVNSLYSIILTNQNAFGVQNILVQEGSNINYTQLAGALNMIEYPAGFEKPQALQLTSTPQEVFNFLNSLVAAMETLSGINSVTRGNPEASLRSGNSLALVQAQAVQFASGLQQSYIRLIENLGLATIKVLQDYAKAPRVAAIVGKSNRAFVKEFTGADVSKINRVVCDVSNPISRTTAGKLDMANNLLQYQIIDNAKDYLMVLNTGNLETLTQSTQNELFLISSENDRLLDGETATAMFLDSHLEHIKEHKALLYDVDLRNDPDFVQRVSSHIQQHLDLLRTSDPSVLQMLGEQPLPPPPPPPAPPGPPQGPPGAPQGPGGPQGGPQPPPNAANGQVGPPPSGMEQAQATALPLMPHPPAPFTNMPLTAAGGMNQQIAGIPGGPK